ncbi:MAG: tyrosine--tRNA ligase, partial [Candidatus Anammoxibacter sp.]
MFKEINEQLEVIKRGVVDIISENELTNKLAISKKENKPLRIKLGLDPTAADIHIGNAIPIHKLRAFQDLGHKAILIIGDYTAIVGDPSGVNKTRPQLSHEDVMKNAQTYLDQAGKILDMNNIEIKYNGDWFKKMSFEEVIHLTSKITVARMLERDDFSKRYSSGVPISIHEFIYPLMQGYDSLIVKSDIELGGTDQLFSLLVGRDIQRDGGLPPQVAITTPLLEGLDGNKKMSKSLDNYIGITETPNDMFGKTMSIPDELMKKYFELATDLPMSRINELLDKDVHPKEAKIELSKAVVARYHNGEEANKAAIEFNKIFTERKLPGNIPEIHIADNDLENGAIWIVSLLKHCGLTATNGEAKRLITQGGVKIDDNKQTDYNIKIKPENGMIIRAGKRRFAKI